jgi:hypothetical protein
MYIVEVIYCISVCSLRKKYFPIRRNLIDRGTANSGFCCESVVKIELNFDKVCTSLFVVSIKGKVKTNNNNYKKKKKNITKKNIYI